MKHIIGICIWFCVLNAIPNANAQQPGMYAESVVRVDDATIRRVRDTNTHVVCYLVTNYAYANAPLGRMVAIDCVKE